MTRTVYGHVLLPNGSPLAWAQIQFIASRNSYSADGSTPRHAEAIFTTDQDGWMHDAINLGQYRVELSPSSDAGRWWRIGDAKVETGGAIELGELLEFTDTDLLTSFADIATRTWVQATYSAGTPSSIAITGLDPGRAYASSYIRVNAAGDSIVGGFERAFQYYLGQMAAHRPHRVLA